MFTGIVEAIGEVDRVETGDASACIWVSTPAIAGEVRVGDSVAVNGACLTVFSLDTGRLAFQAVRETLERTNLGELGPGSRVNLERALRADGRLDGHIVQGHVDGLGRVSRLSREAEDVRLFVECDPGLAELLVDKGSVTIDGVSLTVVAVEEQSFDVVLIPHTLEETTLGARRPGDRVNLEADILGKYVRRYLDRISVGAVAGPAAGPRA